MRLALLTMLTSVFAVACGGTPRAQSTQAAPPHGSGAAETAARAPVLPRTGLRLKVTPDTATVTIDGTDYGAAASIPNGVVALASEAHEVTLTLEGHETWRGEVSVGDGIETLEIKLRLSP